jgi:hypothetical protein
MQHTYSSLEYLLRLLEYQIEDENVPMKMIANALARVRKEYPKC